MSINATAKSPVIIPPEKAEHLARLTAIPKVAWPSVFLLGWIVVGVGTTDALALAGLLPLWAACLLNIVWMWPSFHVLHDALHGAISTNKRFNDLVGSVCLLFTFTEVTLSMFRMAHMIHHRFTNTDDDPDHYVFAKSWLMTIFRWMTFEYYYVWYNWRYGTPRARQLVKRNLLVVAVVLAVVAMLAVAGYGMEVLLLWFVPSRIVLTLIACVFIWMPHLAEDRGGGLEHIHPARSSLDNLTAGTTMRLGHEGVLAPLLQWHNYHLIHHLWPSTPSYNMARVWRLLEPELRARDLHIQHGFALRPKFYKAGSTLSA